MVGAHIGVGFGDAFRFGGQVAQGAFQAGALAGVLNGVDGLDGGFQYGFEVVADDSGPLAGDGADDIGAVFDGVQVADGGQPPSVGDALVEHGGVHQQQGGDGAAVGLLLAVFVAQVVQPEVAVQFRAEFIGGKVVGGFPDAVFQDVEVSDDPIAGQSGFFQQVGPDGVAVFRHTAQQQQLVRLLLRAFGAGRMLLWRVIDAGAGAIIDHTFGFLFGLFDVHRPWSAVEAGFAARHGVDAQFVAAVAVLLAGDDLRRLGRAQRRWFALPDAAWRYAGFSSLVWHGGVRAGVFVRSIVRRRRSGGFRRRDGPELGG